MTMMTTSADKLTRFVRTAKGGDAFIYHVGMIANDRDFALGNGTRVVHDLACLATAFEAQNLIYLTQRRLGTDRYEYIAVRSSKPAAEYSTPLEVLAA